MMLKTDFPAHRFPFPFSPPHEAFPLHPPFFFPLGQFEWVAFPCKQMTTVMLKDQKGFHLFLNISSDKAKWRMQQLFEDSCCVSVLVINNSLPNIHSLHLPQVLLEVSPC
jgi:hypothetical protein